MTTYIIRQLLLNILILFLLTIIVFFVMRLLPGDPLIIFLGQSAGSGNMSMQELDHLRVEYGLDKPLVIQYISWLNGIFHGNLGISINYKENVGKLIMERFPISLQLDVLALIVSTFFGILLGITAAVRRGTWIDTLVTSLANIGISMPVFWLGLMMMMVFGLKLGWLPIAGWTSPFDDFLLSIRKMVMPVICIAFTSLAGMARQMRSSMLEVIRQDYIRTAWSKGLKERTIIMRHIVKNSLIPVITLLGIAVGYIFTGSFFIEQIFAIPGVGRLLISSIFAKDYIVIQSCTLIIASIIVMVNLIVNISYGWFDPRIRYS